MRPPPTHLTQTVVVVAALVTPGLEQLVVEPEELENTLPSHGEHAAVLRVVTQGRHWAQAWCVAQPQHRKYLK